MSQHVEATPVYYHNCRALGDHTKVPRALMADSSGEFILYYQHKCPFCSYVAGERVYAKGVTPTATGYDIDVTIAERLRG